MEAFRGRGGGDVFGSHDLDDSIAVVEGRDTLLNEIAAAPHDMPVYLSEAAKELLGNERFRDALPGYLPGDQISQQRLPIIIRRLTEMTRLLGAEIGNRR